ncbi:MAG TPA: adenylate/guanylate cyclase domain-containing protein [Casimicrobiaceae bacterium]|nr:adenylate/guanylate cyclase domain-containing protein [Casimicrobiaceae bacterium]
MPALRSSKLFVRASRAWRWAASIARRSTGAPRALVGLAIIALFLLHPLTDFGKSAFPLLPRLEGFAYDMRLKLTLPQTTDPQVVVIDIDEGSLQRLGRWPWSRDKVASLTRQLFELYSVRAVGFDILFAERDLSSGIGVLDGLREGELRSDAAFKAALTRLRPELDYDARFAAAMRGHPVVLALAFPLEAETRGALPPPVFTQADLGGRTIPIVPEHGYVASLPELAEAAAASGHVDPAFDADNQVRRVPMVKRYGDGYFPALSLAMVKTVVEAKKVVPHFDSGGSLDALDVGGLSVPVDEYGTALIPFRGKSKTFRFISAADVLDGTAPRDFAGAIALVGTSAKGLKDLRPTPLDPDFAGVEIHANLIAGMLDGDIKSVPARADAIEAIVMFVAGLLALFALPYRRPLLNALGLVVIAGLVTALNMALWTRASYVVPLATTLFMLAALFAWNMLAGFLREGAAIRRLSTMFGEYVPPERVAQMRDSGERFSMEGESRELTVMFCDVRDFTAHSEHLSPRQLSAMLNAYLTTMTAIIHERRGTIDKYVGDSIMAFWGAPEPNPEHARGAVEAALAMQARMPALAKEFARRGWPSFKIGIGINTGAMNIGDMGSKFRKAYTVLGDSVNLASRLEGLTKEYGTGIIVGENTARGVPDFAWREIDRVRVVGRATAVTIYEPLGRATDPEVDAELALHRQALASYRGRNFEAAEAGFAALAAAHPATGIYTLFRARCAAFRSSPPPAAWEGSTVFATK